MKAEQARSSIQKLRRQYFLLRSIEISFFSISAGLIAFASLTAIDFALNLSLTVMCSVLVMVLLGRRYKLQHLNSNFFTSYLNHRFPQLNESADLLLVNDRDLSSLQQIQKEKVLSQLDQILPD